MAVAAERVIDRAHLRVLEPLPPQTISTESLLTIEERIADIQEQLETDPVLDVCERVVFVSRLRNKWQNQRLGLPPQRRRQEREVVLIRTGDRTYMWEDGRGEIDKIAQSALRGRVPEGTEERELWERFELHTKLRQELAQLRKQQGQSGLGHQESAVFDSSVDLPW